MRFLTGVNLLCFYAGKLHQAGTSVFMLWRDATEKEERGEIARQKVAEGEAGRGEGPKEKQKEVSSQLRKINPSRQLIQRPPTPTAVPGPAKHEESYSRPMQPCCGYFLSMSTHGREVNHSTNRFERPILCLDNYHPKPRGFQDHIAPQTELCLTRGRVRGAPSRQATMAYANIRNRRKWSPV